MASFLKFLGRFSPLKRESPSENIDEREEDNSVKTFTSILSPFESYVVSIQSILIWEKPYASVLAVFVINVLFWFSVYCQFRFYFVLSSLAAACFVYRAWVNQIWPEIRVPLPEGEDTEGWTPVHPQVLSVPEISKYLSDLCVLSKTWYVWLISLRSQQPGTFTGMMIITLSILAFIGHHVSGVFLAYMLVMGIMLVPGIFLHLYPKFFSQYLTERKHSEIPEEPRPNVDLDIDEFLPETNDREVMEALSLPLKAADSFSNASLLTEDLGIDEMISHVISIETPIETPTDADLIEFDKATKESDDDDDSDILPYEHETPAAEGEMQFITGHFDNSSSDEIPESSETEKCDALEIRDTYSAPIVSDNPDDHNGDDIANMLYESFSSEAKTVTAVAEDIPHAAASSIPTEEMEEPKEKSQTSSSDSLLVKHQMSTSSDQELMDYEIISDSDL